MPSDFLRTVLRRQLMVLVLLGAIIRFSGLGTNSFWLDEMTSLTVALSPLGDIVSGGVFDNHTPPLYYALLHGWLRVAPASEVGLRSLSAVIDTANIVLCFWAFSPILPGLSALLLAFLYAISAYSVYFAQEARMYPLLVFWCLLLQGTVLRAGFAAAWRSWKGIAATGLIAAAGMYTHYYFAPFGLALGLCTLIQWRDDRTFIRFLLLSAALSVMLFVPWVPVVLNLAGSGGQKFRQFLTLMVPYAFFRFNAGYGNLPIELDLKLHLFAVLRANWPLLAAYIAAPFALLCYSFVLSRRLNPSATFILGTSLLLPPTLMLVLSFRSPMFSERYLCVVFPQYLALLSLGLNPFLEPAAAPPAIRLLRTGCFGLMLFALLQHFQNPRLGFSDWRGAAKILRSELHAEGGGNTVPVVVRPEYAADVLRYYTGSGVQVIRYSDTLQPEQMVSPAQHSFGCVETASDDPRCAAFARDGFSVVRETILPFENGLRVVLFARPSRETQ